jgi:hypothetical protein
VEAPHRTEALKKPPVAARNAPFDTPRSRRRPQRRRPPAKSRCRLPSSIQRRPPEKGTLNHLLSQVKNDIFYLGAAADQDTNPILPEKYKPLLRKIGPQQYLRNIKKYTEQIYKILST